MQAYIALIHICDNCGLRYSSIQLPLCWMEKRTPSAHAGLRLSLQVTLQRITTCDAERNEMRLIKGIGIFFAFLASSCLAGIAIKTTPPAESDLVEAVVKILESCYRSRITPVGLTGSLSGMISEALSSQKSLPVTLIDADTRLVGNGLVHRKRRNKLQVFVVTASSSSTLTKTLGQIKASIWWNHMANFLILDWPRPDHGCSNTFELLWTVWDMNILKGNLVCHDRSRGLLIYTFNPYTRQAPSPWQLDKTFTGKNHHPWALFVREYRNRRGICSGLDFDKTRDLGGYKIRVSVTDSSHTNEGTNSNHACGNVFADIFCGIIFPALNAKPQVLVGGSVNSIGFVDPEGRANGILANVANGFSDFATTTRFLTTVENLTFAYPHWQGELLSLTRYRGYKSQLSKISSVVDSSSRYGLLLTCFITLAFFKLLVRQSVVVAFLSTLRIICNSPLPKLPRKLAPRIYLGSLLILALTLQGIYQGKLASLLTSQEPLPNVNTMRDLARMGHMVYGSHSYKLFFNDPEFKDRYVTTQNETCAEYALSERKAACVGHGSILRYQALMYKLHLSSEALALVHGALPIRPDWPLEHRFNTILLRSIDASLLMHRREEASFRSKLCIEIQEAKYEESDSKVLTLKQLSFAFVILGIGLGCATVTFIIEVGLSQRSRVRPRMVRSLIRACHYIIKKVKR